MSMDSPDKLATSPSEATERAAVGPRELNALVAANVMGWSLCRDKSHVFGTWHDEEGSYRGMENDPEFSTEIADAFRVVEKMTKMGWNFRVSQCGQGPGNHVARFWGVRGITSMADGDSAPEAICRAALKALAERPDSAPLPEKGASPAKERGGDHV